MNLQYKNQHLDYSRPLVWVERGGEVVAYYDDESPRRYLNQRGEPAGEDVVKRVIGESAKS
jgi:hypothetical protein